MWGLFLVQKQPSHKQKLRNMSVRWLENCATENRPRMRQVQQISKMTYYVSSRTLNPTHSLPHCRLTILPSIGGKQVYAVNAQTSPVSTCCTTIHNNPRTNRQRFTTNSWGLSFNRRGPITDAMRTAYRFRPQWIVMWGLLLTIVHLICKKHRIGVYTYACSLCVLFVFLCFYFTVLRVRFI